MAGKLNLAVSATGSTDSKVVSIDALVKSLTPLFTEENNQVYLSRPDLNTFFNDEYYGIIVTEESGLGKKYAINGEMKFAILGKPADFMLQLLGILSDSSQSEENITLAKAELESTLKVIAKGRKAMTQYQESYSNASKGILPTEYNPVSLGAAINATLIGNKIPAGKAVQEKSKELFPSVTVGDVFSEQSND